MLFLSGPKEVVGEGGHWALKAEQEEEELGVAYYQTKT
jgi:hypothetical protein